MFGHQGFGTGYAKKITPNQNLNDCIRSYKLTSLYMTCFSSVKASNIISKRFNSPYCP